MFIVFIVFSYFGADKRDNFSQCEKVKRRLTAKSSHPREAYKSLDKKYKRYVYKVEVRV